MGEFIETSDINEELASYYEQVVTTRLNQLFTSIFNYDEDRIQAYDLNQESGTVQMCY